QLSLFDEEPEAPPAPADPVARLPTSQDRLLEARRDFHRATSQATERLVLSYPRADPRTGRERMPSLFFVAAASAREGRPVGAAEVRRKLDPVTADRPISASRLATFSRCGFLYLMQYVLRLEPAREPEERKRLDPLERGSVFHEVAERFLRELRDGGELPVRDT